MSLQDRLESLLQSLAGAAWREKFPFDWTPDEKRAFEKASDEERLAWLDEIMDRPLPVYQLEPGEEPPADLPPDVVIIPSADVSEFEDHA